MTADLRNRIARALFIASEGPEVAGAWDAPGDHGRQRWWNYADAVLPILAAEKAKWQAEGAVSALRQAADLAEPFSGAALPSSPSRPMFAVWLRDRADRIEEGLRRLGVGAATVAARPVQDDATSTTHQEEP